MPTEALMGHRAKYVAEVAAALEFIRPRFKEEMRGPYEYVGLKGVMSRINANLPELVGYVNFRLALRCIFHLEGKRTFDETNSNSNTLDCSGIDERCALFAHAQNNRTCSGKPELDDTPSRNGAGAGCLSGTACNQRSQTRLANRKVDAKSSNLYFILR